MAKPQRTTYRYIEWIGGGGSDWTCKNRRSDTALGEAGYYTRWKQWVFVPAGIAVIFSHDCLIDIANFLKQLNDGPPPDAGKE